MSDGEQTGTGAGPNRIGERVNDRKSRGNTKNVIDTERAQATTTIKNGIRTASVNNPTWISRGLLIPTAVQLIHDLDAIAKQTVTLRPYN